jgi:hypothetical protein
MERRLRRRRRVQTRLRFIFNDALVPICWASGGAIPARAGEKPQGYADSDPSRIRVNLRYR